MDLIFLSVTWPLAAACGYLWAFRRGYRKGRAAGLYEGVTALKHGSRQ